MTTVKCIDPFVMLSPSGLPKMIVSDGEGAQTQAVSGNWITSGADSGTCSVFRVVLREDHRELQVKYRSEFERGGSSPAQRVCG